MNRIESICYRLGTFGQVQSVGGAETPRDRISDRATELDGEIAEVEQQLSALTAQLDDKAAVEAAELVFRLRALRSERAIITDTSTT